MRALSVFAGSARLFHDKLNLFHPLHSRQHHEHIITDWNPDYLHVHLGLTSGNETEMAQMVFERIRPGFTRSGNMKRPADGTYFCRPFFSCYVWRIYTLCKWNPNLCPFL